MKIFLYILVLLLGAALTIVGDHFLFVKQNKAGIIIKNSFKIFFLINLLNLTIFYNIYGYKNIFMPDKQAYLFFLYYFLQSILLGGLYLLYKYLLNKYFILEPKEIKHKGGVITLYIVSLALFFLGVLAFSSTAWEQTVYFKANPDQIFITMFTPITGTDPKIITSYIEWPTLLSCCLTYLFALLFYSRINLKIKIKDSNKTICSELVSRIAGIAISSVLVISGFTYLIYGMGLDKIIISYTVESTFIQDNYVNPGDVEIQVPNKKRNLIHFYLESIENSFFDEAHGGIMKENLMPNLLELQKDGINFSNRGKGQGYGGPLKTYGASFSVGSKVNQFFGLPMRVPVQYKQYSESGKFLPGAVGVGDILDQCGYNQTLMLGADSNFSGLHYMFEGHGDFKIMDYKYAIANHLLPSDYKVNWGYEDDKMYEFAKDELTRLASLDQPFHFHMQTADTHNPGFAFDGDKPIFGETDLPENYAKTISYSEKHVTDFIRWVQQQPFYENTTIVIIGDHNTYDGVLFKDVDDNYVRTTYSLILNPDPEVLKATNENRYYNRKWANFDMMPTILTALGFKISGDRLGLGTSLFSNLPTIYERMDYDEVNDLLVCNSSFYNDELVKKKRVYDGSNLINN